MSQFLLCKGEIPLKVEGFKIKTYPFIIPWLDNASDILWRQDKENIWTVFLESNPTDIDFCFIEAQRHIQLNTPFEQTKLSYLLNKILEYKNEIVLWYSDIRIDIPYAVSKEDFVRRVYDGIKEDFCEVYIRYKNY